jgi:hypothetical protein
MNRPTARQQHWVASERVWDEDPRMGGHLAGLFVQVLAAGFPLSILVSLYAGTFEALKYYGVVLLILGGTVLGWCLIAGAMFVLLRGGQFLWDKWRCR